MIGLFATYMALYLNMTVRSADRFPFGDFFSLWSYPRIAAAQSATALYDVPTLHAAQLAMGMAVKTGTYLFAYPPHALLLLWPFAQLPYGAAYAAFMLATLPLYVAAVALGQRPALPIAMLAALAPATTLNLVAGQTGFLIAALLIGGLRLAPIRPLLGGILLGLATYKPQLGILVPVALLATGNWRCIVAAGLTAGVLALAAASAFGAGIWLTWLHAITADSGKFATMLAGNGFMPTITANLQIIGAGPVLTHTAQVAGACAAVALVWTAFRRLPSAPAIAVLGAATFLATPYAFIYDLPLLAGTMLLFLAHRARSGAPLRLRDLILPLLLLALPAAMALPHVPMPLSGALAVAFLLQVFATTPPQPQPQPQRATALRRFGKLVTLGAAGLRAVRVTEAAACSPPSKTG